jgi:hypothetical protein
MAKRKVQKDLQRSTQHTHRTKDRVSNCKTIILYMIHILPIEV